MSLRFARQPAYRPTFKAKTAAEIRAARDLDNALKKIGGEVERAFRRAVDSLRDDIDLGDLTNALKAGDLKRAETIVGAASLSERMGEGGRESMLAQLNAALSAGGDAAGRQLPPKTSSLVGSLNLTNPEAVRYLRETRPSMIREVTTETQEAVRQALQRGMEDGLAAPRMAREIRSLVGLTVERTEHVQNLRRQLETGVIGGQTPPWERRLSAVEARQARRIFDQETPSQDQIDALVDRYAESLTNRRAKDIARTETHRAFVEGQQALWDQATEAGYLDPEKTRRFWLTAGDERVRDETDISHKAIPGMNENGVGLNEPFDTPVGPVMAPGKSGNPAFDIGCFLPGTLVAGPFVAGLEAWYSGEIVELVSAAGRSLSLTVNHPVLTTNGLRPAGLLQEGDYLIADQSKVWRDPLGDPDEENPPAAIEEVFKSLAGSSLRLPSAALDLDGDEAFCNGEVRVVGADCQLGSRYYSASSEFGFDARLVLADVAHVLLAGSCESLSRLGSWMTSGVGLVGLCDLAASLVGGHSGPLQSLGFRLASRLFPILSKDSVDHVPGLGEPLRQAVDGLSRSVVGKERGEIRRAPLSFAPAVPLRVGSRPELDALLSQHPKDAIEVRPEFARELVRCGAGLVAPDKLILVNRARYSGHVYDLQSASGNWIVSMGIVAGNCRCVVSLEIDE